MGNRRFSPDYGHEEFQMFPKKRNNPVVVGIQLLALFLLVRCVMVATGVRIPANVPIVDTALATVVTGFQELVEEHYGR